MRSSAIVRGLPTLTAENIFKYAQDNKHAPLNDKTKQSIQKTLSTRKDLITLATLIIKLNEAKDTINLLHGLTQEQKAELKLLISREREFKRRHREHIAEHDDYKQFIVEQHQILPLQQLITWWDNNHESFMKDEFWEKTTLAAKAQSARRKESEKRKRRRLHRLVDVREDFKQYESYYGFAGEDLLQFNKNFLGFLTELITKMLKNRRSYPTPIADYLSLILSGIENEKKLIIYSMIYRLECAEYYKDQTCDDLMAYTCDRIYKYASLQRDEKKLQPPRRCGLTPLLAETYKQHIHAYAKAHPDDRLISHKLKSIQLLSTPSDSTKSPTTLNNATTPLTKSSSSSSINPDSLTPDLGRLILAIEDTSIILNNSKKLTPENILSFIEKFNTEILIPIDNILLSINQTLSFRHFMQFKLILDYFLQPHLKGLLLTANKAELSTNPYWYHLVNHLGSRKNISELITLTSTQDNSAAFNHVLEFAAHFSKSKHRLKKNIESQLLQEAGLDKKLPLPNEIKLTALLCASDVENKDLLKLWTICANKLKLNHLVDNYDLAYAVNLIKHLGKISNEILHRSINDPIFCHQAIKSFAILDEIKPDIEKCLQQEARTNRFHYLFSGSIDQETLLKPLIHPLNKIYALDLAHKLDNYSKDYARYDKKLAIITSLRTRCSEIIDDKSPASALTEDIHTILNQLTDNNKFSNSYRFQRRLNDLAILSKHYFAPVNQRVFSHQTLKMCSLLN